MHYVLFTFPLPSLPLNFSMPSANPLMSVEQFETFKLKHKETRLENCRRRLELSCWKREREREGEVVACSTLQIHYRLLPLLFPYGISSSPLIEATIGFLSLYEIQISISELRFSFWFCGLFMIFEDFAWFPLVFIWVCLN